MRILHISLVLVLTGCGVTRIRAPYASSPVPPAPDYSKISSWAAWPSKRDAADSVPIGSNYADSQQSAVVDVFFIYPTIFTDKPQNQYKWNADVNDTRLNQAIQQSTILNQATVFNGSCRVYSPYYRQAHLYAFYTPNQQEGESALLQAYEDVRAAFLYYLEHENNGRPLIIASHSQGSYHGVKLLKEFFEGKPLQKKLVAAYLIGRAIPRDTFTEIKPATGADDVGVWISWNTFGRGFIPKNYDRYYTKALSINPIIWSQGEEFASVDKSLGGVGQKFTFHKQLADAQNHKNLLWTNRPRVKGAWLVPNKVWHRADINFYYGNLRENVALRIRKYLEGRD